MDIIALDAMEVGMSIDPGKLWSTSDYGPTANRLRPVSDVIMKRLGQQVDPPANVLELGAGHGALAAELARAGYGVVAIEPSDRMRAIGSSVTGDRVIWIDGRAEATGLEPESFDAVVSSFGLMFADPYRGIRETARILRPGGLLIMTAWAPRGFLHEMTNRMIKVLPQLAGAPHLAWGERAVARDRLREAFDDIAIDERILPWHFKSAEEGMALYRNGSPAHAASFAMAGDRRADLEQQLEDQLRESAGADGSVASSANYLLISGQRK